MMMMMMMKTMNKKRTINVDERNAVPYVSL